MWDVVWFGLFFVSLVVVAFVRRLEPSRTNYQQRFIHMATLFAALLIAVISGFAEAIYIATSSSVPAGLMLALLPVIIGAALLDGWKDIKQEFYLWRMKMREKKTAATAAAAMAQASTAAQSTKTKQ